MKNPKTPGSLYPAAADGFIMKAAGLTNLDIPFSYIKSYVDRLAKGETIERALDEIGKERDKIVEEYKNLIQTDEDRQSFDGAYNTIRTIYRYAEDHLFWVEHWFHTIWYRKIRQIGQLLVDNGMIDQVDDIFMFNRYEIPQLLTEVSTGLGPGRGHPHEKFLLQGQSGQTQKYSGCRRKMEPDTGPGCPACRK